MHLSQDFWRGRKVLVTGATGLVGSSLVKSLCDLRAQVVVFIRDHDPQSELIRTKLVNQVTVVNGELENMASVERAINEFEIDTVFHLGAQAIVGAALRNPLPTFEANIRGTYNLLEACRRHPGLVKRIVIASSDKAYGSGETLPYTEDMAPLGRFPYDVSKSCADLLAQSYFHTYKLPVVIARCGNIIGPGDLNFSRIVPGTIRSVLFGERPIVRSDGKFTRDYVYIKDAVNAYLLMAQKLDEPGVAGEAFNFGPQKPHTVLEVVDSILRLTGRMDLEPIIQNGAHQEIRNQYLSSSKAKLRLGWEPQFSLDDGIRETILWYKEFLKVPLQHHG